MDINLLSILAFGLLLGIKHGLEPDHIIAVSTIASRNKTLWRSSLSGIFWGIGHTTTLFIFSIMIIIFKLEISEKVAMSFEFIVGIILVYLGLMNIFIRKQTHEHDGSQIDRSSYLKSLLIGFIHGLAGSAAMVLLTMSTVNEVWEAVIYILVFGIGTCIGMLTFTTLLGIPFVATKEQVTLNRTLTQVIGLISIFFGLYYMYDLGINEQLFIVWFN